MHKRQKVWREVGTMHLYSPWTVEEVVASLQDYVRNYGPSIFIEMRTDRYDNSHKYIAVLLEEDETDKEFADRIEREEAEQKRAEKYERQAYERLRAKYGN